MAMELVEDADLAAVRDSDATAWLNAPPELVGSVKTVSERIFAVAGKYVPKNPLRKLLTEGFDAEQIWQQIEIQGKPLLSAARRQLKELERLDGADVFGIGRFVKENGNAGEKEASEEEDSENEPSDLHDDYDDAEDDDGDDSGGEGKHADEEEEPGVLGLRTKEMKEYLDAAEREDEDLVDEETRYEMYDAESDDDGNEIMYSDFFEKRKGVPSKRKEDDDERDDEEQEQDEDEDEEKEDEDEEMEDEENELHNDKKDQRKANIQEVTEKSSYEKQLEKTQKRIQELEKANLDPKDWTMRGEISASKRPKNSALEVDLDFEHNARPVPVITEDVTASIEDIIRRRIIDGQFDDVERKQKVLELPPAEKREIDENKSTKGLGEIYEDEYMQSAGLASAPATESDKLKQEAATLFKRLCLKLDALAHFHFAPKPVIEDMAIREDVPALAMEEVAPVFVSDASMLAPEEMFSGKGATKDEKELDRSDRKRRRASKKRKFKAQEKAKEQVKKKPRVDNPVEASAVAAPKKQTSKFVKSAKIFAELDRQKAEGTPKPSSKPTEKAIRPTSLKL